MSRITRKGNIVFIWNSDNLTIAEYNETIVKPMIDTKYQEWLKQYYWNTVFLGPPWQDTQ